MRLHPRTLATLAAVLVCLPAAARAGSKKIDLRTKDGVAAVKGEWRWHDVKVVESSNRLPDGKTVPTYDIEPKASAPNFDDGGWDVIDPTTLKNPRGGGKVCFAWYRIKLTMPEGVEGKTVTFQTTVDDYGEVWVDGQLPRKPGDSGGPIVAGFNAPNRVGLKDPKPGKVYSIAVFGINGPISATPGNRIFLGPTFLEVVD